MDPVPCDANEHCPGTGSESAGKVAACQGCPNQQICASGITQEEDPGIEQVRIRLQSVRHKILILSGKGGVGKSTFTSLLARFLAAEDEDKNVGICDIDICGPSMPRVMGALDEQVHQSGSGWSPVYVDSNLSVMSIGFLLASPDNAVIWRGPKKNAMIRQFLTDVDWGELEYLLIDTPPGTSDEHMSVAKYLSKADIDGAVLVTTPQEVALLDVRKEVDFCRKADITIIGVVENMSSYVCPKCSRESEIFKGKTGGAEKMCSDLKLNFLGRLPLDPRLARCCDEGKNFITEFKDSPAHKSLEDIVKRIVSLLDKTKSPDA
ncbi:UNVERIFIED_CONTAM: hypothetical protein PYX00_008217 [Menopon gallinae]|uniref:Cytosolic Fe-S cluster assembly factor NUBP1 homolog n=1 Tax=Menopon gallinae TaxID=328185 RepID=A0AAW2HND6_9NEOP